MAATRDVDVLLVSSPGGHLLELYSLREVWEGFTRLWVTMDRTDSRSLLRGEDVHFAHPQVPRSGRNLWRNLVDAWRLLGRVRPSVLITTGAALAVPYVWVARVRGARVVYVESATRIHDFSLTCRLVAPFAHRVYVQWPELAARRRGVRYAGRVFGAEL